jgi:hypothetical protein
MQIALISSGEKSQSGYFNRATLSTIDNFAELVLRHYAVLVPSIGIDYT